jgi:hypothetical protein
MFRRIKNRVQIMSRALDTNNIDYNYWKNGFLKNYILCRINNENNTKSKSSKKEIITVFLMLFVLRIMKMIRIDEQNNKLLVYFGSPWHYLGANNFYFETLLGLWTLYAIAFYLFLNNSQNKHYEWFEIFEFLNGIISYDRIGISFENFFLSPKLRYLLSINFFFTSLGLTNSKDSMKLMKRSKIILFICHKYIYSIILGAIIVGFIATGFNYSVYDFCVFGILWMILWTIWALLISHAQYWPPGYYSIICYYLKLRINAFRFKLNNFKTASGQPSLKIGSNFIQNILREHNNLCIKISEYNKYWKIYLTISILLYIVIICYLSYLIFIARLDLVFRIELLIVLSAHLLLLFIITYSASSISHYNRVLFCDLYSFCVKNKLQIHSKLMVSNK